MPMTPKEMTRFLKKNKFQKVDGGKGGHQKFYNPKSNRTTEVPMHNRDLTKGEEHDILKQANLLEEYRKNK